MPSKLETRDLPDRLEYRVTGYKSRGELALIAGGSAVVLAIWFYVADYRPLYVLGGIALAAFDAYELYRALKSRTDVTLTVTKDTITSEGRTYGEYAPYSCARIACPDLSFNVPRRRHDSRPRGLFLGSRCVLPGVNEVEALKIIEAIYTRFPDTASQAEGDSAPKSSGLTVLNLRT